MTTPAKPKKQDRSRLLLGGLVVALVASLIACVALGMAAKRFYVREMLVRLQPAGGDPFVKSGNPKGPRVLFLGDSRITAWPVLPADRFYTINAGVYAETTAQVRVRVEAVLSAERPDIVVLQAGINDLKAIGILPQAATQIEERCVKDLLDMVMVCRQRGVRVVMTCIIPPGKVSLIRRFVWSPEILTSLHEVNAKLRRQLANADGVALLDCDKVLNPGDTGDINPADYSDTLHLNPAAYEKLQKALLPLVESLLPKP